MTIYQGKSPHALASFGCTERFAGEVLVCTGHDPPSTEMQTMEWNRENNPVLKMQSYEEYAEWQESTSANLGYVSKIKTACQQISSQKFLKMSHG